MCATLQGLDQSLQCVSRETPGSLAAFSCCFGRTSDPSCNMKRTLSLNPKELRMIDLYFWPTPNGYKITWMLEEVGLKYNVIPVNIGAGDQFKPEFLKISPNNRMPAMTDPDGPGGKPISIFESRAILMYLAEKTGKLMPSDTRGKYNVIQWLMFQMASVGPMLGQAHHFRRYAPEKLDYAINRYTNEAKRIYGVIDKRLGEAKYLAG